jgi:transcriptional regulator of heat shock response
MFVTPLNTRGKKVLQAIVESYIETASPVSSQTITQRFRSRSSPATIRNVMGQLDEMGLVWQPHTSAGRIPTDEGYRYYIDSLLDVERLSVQDRELIESQCLSRKNVLDDLLTETLRILSNLSGYPTLAFSYFTKTRLYVERVSYFFEQPEFQDTQKLRAIIKTFEQQEPLLEIMREDLHPDGIKVHIGKENPCEEIRECSLVISNFKIKNRNIGTLGIIGPRRMFYSKVISAVSYMARILGERITDPNI